MTATAWPDDDVLLSALGSWLPGQRWYPAKDVAAGGGGAGATVVSRLELRDPEGAALVADALIRVPSSEGSVIVQVPLVLEAPRDGGGLLHDPPGAIATLADGSVLCDGPHHPAFLRAWTALAVEQGSGAGLAPLDPSRARVLRGEQSNTSVLIPRRPDAGVGPDGILKAFRVVGSGANPEIEVPVALVAAGWRNVPEPLGWVEGSWTEDGVEHHGHLGVVAAFVPGAHDGFELACFYAREGTSFASLAADLGRTIAQMHRALAIAFPPKDDRDGRTRAAALAASLRARVEWAAGEVRELAELLPAVEAVIAEVEALPDVPLDQRVHGDFHLGQCLHSDAGWFVLDFEGEPLRSLEDRTKPDQALRDLAGAIRSIDYAAAVGNGTPEWAAESRSALQDAYITESVALSDHPVVDATSDGVLERALLLERALYEAVYEARNRPDWLSIPLEAIRREVSP
jgi:trehalose synthase-fused probable maltokinase